MTDDNVIRGRSKKTKARAKERDASKKKGTVSAKLPKTAAKSYIVPPLDRVLTKIVIDNEKFIPQYATEDSVSVGLIANLPEGASRMPHRAIVEIDCGFSMTLKAGYRAVVVPRSGIGNRGLIISNGHLEQGRVKVTVMNAGKEILVVSDGDIFAEMYIEPVYRFDWAVE